jgi:xanthine dehydrogenase YagS FAD-binding subunit
MIQEAIKMADLDIFNSRTVDEVLIRLGKQWWQPRHVEHFNARTIDEALSLLNLYREEAKIIAGGIDVITLMKSRVKLPNILVNLKSVSGLSYIEKNRDGLKIGPLTTVHDIEMSAVIKEIFPILTEAAHSVGAPQIRNMATLGGNLCQEVRCWYYRRSPGTGRTFFCRRKGGEECYAVNGDNRYHAIIGYEDCHAVCPSDMAPALIALDATVKIASQNGDRIIPLEKLYTTMGNILQPGEIITEIQVPSPESYTKQRYLKFRIRKAIDFAISSVSLVLNIEGEIVRDARIVLGGVAPTPLRATAAEDVLIGEPITQNIAAVAAEAAVSGAVPLSMNRYKVHITKSLVKKGIIE